jgi:hypothetical protein
VRRNHQLRDRLAIVIISSVASGHGHLIPVFTSCATSRDGYIAQASEHIHSCFPARPFETRAPAIHGVMNLRTGCSHQTPCCAALRALSGLNALRVERENPAGQASPAGFSPSNAKTRSPELPAQSPRRAGGLTNDRRDPGPRYEVWQSPAPGLVLPSCRAAASRIISTPDIPVELCGESSAMTEVTPPSALS